VIVSDSGDVEEGSSIPAGRQFHEHCAMRCRIAVSLLHELRAFMGPQDTLSVTGWIHVAVIAGRVGGSCQLACC
jgi:hypothetical protein